MIYPRIKQNRIGIVSETVLDIVPEIVSETEIVAVPGIFDRTILPSLQVPAYHSHHCRHLLHICLYSVINSVVPGISGIPEIQGAEIRDVKTFVCQGTYLILVMFDVLEKKFVL